VSKRQGIPPPRLVDVINPLSPSFFLYRPWVLVPVVILLLAFITLTLCSALSDWQRLCNKVEDFHSDVQVGQSRAEALELASSMGLSHKCLAEHCELDEVDIMYRVDLVHCEETDCSRSKLILVSERPFSEIECACVLVLSNGTVTRKHMAVPNIE
jgi:hypothetical protein